MFIDWDTKLPPISAAGTRWGLHARRLRQQSLIIDYATYTMYERYEAQVAHDEWLASSRVGEVLRAEIGDFRILLIFRHEGDIERFCWFYDIPRPPAG